MIRDHLLKWHAKHKMKNYPEYRAEVAKLPQEDRRAAILLFHSPHRLVVLALVAHLEREELPDGALAEGIPASC